MVAPLFVGREQSVNALNHVMTGDKKIFLLSQKNSKVDNPDKENLYSFGTVAKIIQLLKLPDGTVKVLVEGSKRVKITEFMDEEKFIKCQYEFLNDLNEKNEDLSALAGTALKRLEKLSSINKKISNETISTIKEAGFNRANKARSIAASVWPALFNTPPFFAKRGKTCPGLENWFALIVSSISAFIVFALSLAEIPVVTPLPLRSTETVNAVS